MKHREVPKRILFHLTLTCLVPWLALIAGERIGHATESDHSTPEHKASRQQRLQIVANISSDPDRRNLPLLVHGSAEINGLPLENGSATKKTDRQTRCFYLPFNDDSPDLHLGAVRRFDYLAEKTGRVRMIGGQTKVTIGTDGLASNAQIETLRPQVVKVTWYGESLKLNYESRLPRPASFAENDFLFEGFYPIPLESCPIAPFDSAYFRASYVSFSGTVFYPHPWQYIGPGDPSNLGTQMEGSANDAPLSTAHIVTHGRSFGFVLAKELKKKVVTTSATRGPNITLWYRTAEFADLSTSIHHAYETQLQIFGAFPFESLSIVETSESERAVLPGLITLSRPKQALLQLLQSEWLNWRQWLVTAYIANQWIGQFVGIQSPDDSWLVDGISDYATLETLAKGKIRYNLFNTFGAKSPHIFSFNYLQVQELIASALRRASPVATLANENLDAKLPIRNAHPLLFIKHAMAMRQIRSQLGSESVKGWLRQVIKKFARGSLTPKAFYGSLQDAGAPFSAEQRAEISGYLKTWWTTPHWPDPSLYSLDSHNLPDGRWHVTAIVRQNSNFVVPIRVTFFANDSERYSVAADPLQSASAFSATNAHSDSTFWIASGSFENPIERAVVDADHEIYDADRYNNRSDITPLKFFPGNARTLADDEYTLIWAPYAFRHPGEPVSVGVQGILFKYLHSSTRGRIENYPADGRGAGFLNHITDLPDYKLALHGLFKHEYSQNRMIEAGIARSPFIFQQPLTTLSLKLRHRDSVIESSATHGTYAIALSMRQISAISFLKSGRLSFESEEAPRSAIKKFGYSRRTLIGDSSIELHRRLDLGFNARVFRGLLAQDGEPPSAARFKVNQLDEARVRIDRRDLPAVGDITSLSSEVTAPLFIPLPWNSLVLSRNIKWRVFYDFARGSDLRTHATGLGLDIPFGGDIIGGGSMTFSRLSLLTVLDSSFANADVQYSSKKPSFLFDITGEL